MKQERYTVEYHIWTIGCQMNLADSQRVAAGLERLGYRPTAQPERADIVILNTCVVRQQAEDKVLARIEQLRPLKERKPDLLLVVMGCLYRERDLPALQARYPWVDLFLPPSDATGLWLALSERGVFNEAEALMADAEQRHRGLPAPELVPTSERGQVVSAYLPIVLGCSHACTYCVIPYRRGPERSRPLEAILAEAQALVAQGVREITLLGQIVDRYGYDLLEFQGAAETPLVTLLRRLHELEGLARLRFLTSHPNWMRDDLLEAVATLPKVCEHFELPIQAGDDEVLARMRRGYTVADYRRLVARIRERLPGASIATDIIVGFPGETAEQFQHTYDLLAELRLDKAHIARYSPRPLTVATRTYPDDVDPEEKERRRLALDQLQTRILTERNAAYLGQTVEVLVEGYQAKRGRWYGRTRTERTVFFPAPAAANLLGRLVNTRITWTGPWSLIGELTE